MEISEAMDMLLSDERAEQLAYDVGKILDRYSDAGDDLETSLGIDIEGDGDESTVRNILWVAEWLESEDAAEAYDSEGQWAVQLANDGMSVALRSAVQEHLAAILGQGVM